MPKKKTEFVLPEKYLAVDPNQPAPEPPRRKHRTVDLPKWSDGNGPISVSSADIKEHSIYFILDDIRGILRDIKDGSGSLSPAMPGDGGRTPVRVVSAPDPENEALWERVWELTGLLEEWRRAPLFTDTEKYVAWLQSIGPRVDAAIEKVEQMTSGQNAEKAAAKKGRKK